MLVETKQVRRQADDLLQRLLECRAAIERRSRETGRPDPLKSITGRSALDDAVDTVRDLIARADHLIGESNGTSRANGTTRVEEAWPDPVAAAAQ